MSGRGALPREQLETAHEGLKEFQKQTVRAVVDGMFDAESPQRRFLVADEVGLGKTKVARSVVAETIERLWDDPDTDRIDIIYICSNHQIAKQNLRDLRILTEMEDSPIDRITMLPMALADLGKKRVNLVAFTPGTSLNFGHAGGQARERAMLFHLLAEIFPPNVMNRSGTEQLLSLRKDSYYWHLDDLRSIAIPAHVTRAYRRVLKRERLDMKFLEFSDGRRSREDGERRHLIGELRRALAEACIELLTPDLIILDEFQRFTRILDGDREDAALAQMLFEQKGARVLLLSATPYRMLSRAYDEESHFKGFERTFGFLLGPERASELQVLRDALTEMRRGILGHRDPEQLAQARDRAQELLRSVMVRTERLAATSNRSGMLRDERTAACHVTPADVRSFLGVDGVVRTLADVPGMVEYWKSAPYVFNFMDEYKVRKEIDRRIDADGGEIRAGLNGSHMLDWSRIDRYRTLDPSNGRLRWLLEDLASIFHVSVAEYGA